MQFKLNRFESNAIRVGSLVQGYKDSYGFGCGQWLTILGDEADLCWFFLDGNDFITVFFVILVVVRFDVVVVLLLVL
jgi:hypothetical protein